MTLYDIILTGSREYPSRPALYYRDQALTYGELAEWVNRTASAMQKSGIRPGDRVAVLLPNCPQFTAVYFACAAIGAVCVPANPLLKPAELKHIWADSRVRALFTVPQLLPGSIEAKAEVPSLTTVVVVGEAEGAVGFDEYIASGAAEAIHETSVSPSDAAVCIYTSGTTGRPKGALLSHANLIANCEQIRDALDIGEKDNFLCVLPLFHSFAGTVCQNASLFHGASTTLLDAFHPARVLEAVEQRRSTIFAGVPAMYGALIQFPADREYDFTSVRYCVSGGAPMPPALLAAFEAKFNTIILEGDGPTECGPCTAVNRPDMPRKIGSIGPAVDRCEMRIVDEQDNELAVGEVGEIVVRGPNVMIGYHNLPEETAEAMKNGWYHTGDLGHVDEDGYFYIVDRKKDMLLVGGLNVYPREIEDVLYQHAAVLDAAVIGASDDLKGDEVVAVVTLKPGAEATDRELIRFCRESLANYKVPRRVIFRENLPRGGTGKVLKRLLRKEMEMEQG